MNTQFTSKVTLCISLWGLLCHTATFADGHGQYLRNPIQGQHLNLDYADKKGEGDVEFLSYQVDVMAFSHKRLRASIEMNERTLTLSDGVTRFSIIKILDFINRFESIHAEDLNFFFENSHMNGTLTKGFVGIGTSHYLLNALSAQCGSVDHDVPIDDDTLKFIFEMCMQKSEVKLDEMTFPESSNLKAAFEGTLNSFIEAFHPAKNRMKIERIHDSLMAFKDHDFQMSTHVKTWIDLHIWAEGHVDFDEEKAAYRVDLQKAHVGIIPVKHWVFKALKSLNDPNLVVQEPYIYISYKTLKPPKP